MNYTLSSSNIKKGKRCRKALWLQKHNPELKNTAAPRGQRSLQIGKKHLVTLAWNIFPKGVAVTLVNRDYEKAILESQQLINSGQETIYKGVFSHAGTFVFTDILHKGKEGWELIEVASSSKIKDSHIFDLALKYYILKENNIEIKKSTLLYLNNHYTKKGELSLYKLFLFKNLQYSVEKKVPKIQNTILNLQETLSKPCPNIEIGKFCLSPYDCEFKDHCFSHIPSNSIFDLRGRGIDKFKYYKKGIIRFSDLSLEELNDNQRMQVEAVLEEKTFINKEEITKFLETISTPVFFLDFESIQTPAPFFDHTKSYDQVVFQYSLHSIMTPEGEVKHYEFLAEPGVDQREDMIKSLISRIPPNACIIAYNIQFEKQMIKSLGHTFPQYKKELMQRYHNFRDLMTPFQQKYYYKKEMKGSCSLKNVLPALIPNLNYTGLEIGNGEEAMNAYTKLFFTKDPLEIEQVKKNLLEYCKLDTLALVELYKHLMKV